MATKFHVEPQNPIAFFADSRQKIEFSAGSCSPVAFHVETKPPVVFSIKERGSVQFSPKVEIIERDAAPYTGEYEFTPTEETQIVPIAGKTAAQNIVINPIPADYGKVTWIGGRILLT